MSQNKSTISPESAAFRKKRLAIGAASVLTAGALLGVGAQGATAAPLNASSDTESTSSSSEHATSDGHILASLKKELRADLSEGKDAGEKAQNVAETLAGHPVLFESLPANLQTDLTELKDASATDRTAVAETITATAVDGGYGELVQKLALKIEEDPTHPLAGLRAAIQGDLAHDNTAGPSVEKIVTTLLDTPALFDKLPTELQTDLTAVKDAPDADRAAALQEVQSSALNGDYGQFIQTVAERLVSGTDAKAGAHAEAETGN